jgi:hypothetical protein
MRFLPCRQRGEAATLTVLLFLLSTLGAANLGIALGNYNEIIKRAPTIGEDIQDNVDRLWLNGRISRAKAENIKRAVERNRELVSTLTLKLLDRGEAIFSANAKTFLVDLAATAVGKPALRHVSARLQRTRYLEWINELRLIRAKDSVSFSTWTAGLATPTEVDLKDFDGELKELATAIREVDTGFHQAMVAARIRSFWDHVNELDISKERKVAWFRKVVKTIADEGWTVPGVDMTDPSAVARHAVEEIQRYRQETEAEPVLRVHSTTAAPREVLPGDVVKLASRIDIKGVRKGELAGRFLVDGQPAPTRIILSGRLDQPAEALAEYRVSESAKPGPRDVKVTIQLSLPETLAERWGKTRLTAEDKAGFQILHPGDPSALIDRYDRTNLALYTRSNAQCCRTWGGSPQACPPGSDTFTENPCCKEVDHFVLEADCDLNTFPVPWSDWSADLYEKRWYGLSEGFLPCMEKVVARWFGNIEPCYAAWATTSASQSAAARGEKFNACYKQAADDIERRVDACMQQACSAHCAKQDKSGTIARLVSTECLCQ